MKEIKFKLDGKELARFSPRDNKKMTPLEEIEKEDRFYEIATRILMVEAMIAFAIVIVVFIVLVHIGVTK